MSDQNKTPAGGRGALELTAATNFAEDYRATRKFAAAYAALGWRTFPLKPGSKQPATPRGFHDATTDADLIDRFPEDSNIGIATGSAFWALDVDGPEGRASLEVLEAQHGPLPATLTQRTRNGGLHYVFQAAPNVRSRAGLLPGIDARGFGGYAVVEPSQVDADDPSGPGRYSWLDWEPTSGEIPEIAEAPPWLLALVQDAAPATAAPATAGRIVEGGRNDHLSRRAYALRKAGAETAEILASLRRINAKECSPPLDEAELQAIARGKAGIPPDQIEAPVEPTEPPLKIVDLSAADTPEPQFWVDGILPAGAVTLLGAHGGSGKSTLSLGLAAHLAAGKAWAGLAVKKARVGEYSGPT
ncbi:hypothetical protein THICB3320144 [Thiomonas sp. CB3]|nr:hypothetical protein THICB3320144 [Thiomonas sp. CB3]